MGPRHGTFMARILPFPCAIGKCAVPNKSRSCQGVDGTAFHFILSADGRQIGLEGTQ